ncbi:MAG: glycosyltransferase family 4 protein [Planctomycetota bacterium]|jgi:phosphatidylinositol alpha-1,6-mannosyltransferase
MTPPECVLITDDHLPHIGGSRLYVHHAAENLSSQLRVVTRYRRGSEEFDAAAGYSITRARLGGGLLPPPRILGETADALTLARIALGRGGNAGCFLAGEMGPAAVAASLLARLKGTPYGLILHDEPFAGCGYLETRLRMCLMGKSAAIVVSSSYPERRAREITGGAVTVLVAPPGVDFDTFGPGEPDEEALNRFGLEPGRFVLSVGRLVEYKNVEALIEAVAAFEDPALKAVIVGEGPDRPRLEALARHLSLSGRVVFAGRIERQVLVNLYRAALAYVFPSRRSGGQRHEGIGMAALEAAACGCCVIASSETSATDFVTEGATGLVFDPEGTGALEAAIKRLLSAKDTRLEMARAGMKTVRERFTWPNTARVLETAIDLMCGRGG